ncbi:MAG: release factor glutamine methyltransferase [Candidatus Babeliales bacterium]
MFVNHLISLIQNKLANKFEDPILCQQYAHWLLQFVTQKSEIELLTQQEIEWTPTHQKQIDDALDKLINQNMPLAYLLGSIPFAGLDILIQPPILIPRAETEQWVCDLIDELFHVRNEPFTILDLCTGSGCIALAFACAFPKAKVYATDINKDALELAQLNAKHNQISNVTFLYSDLFEAIPKDLKFDLIVANPPYIPEAQWSQLEPSVKNWEDKNALMAPDAGMALIKKIIDQAPAYLKAHELLENYISTQLAIEIDATQGTAVSTYLKNHGYTHVSIIKDLEGKDRLACGRIVHVASSTYS